MACSLFGINILTPGEKDQLKSIQNGARVYIARIEREEKLRQEKERREKARLEAEKREAERRERERREAARKERERLEAERRERERLEKEKGKGKPSDPPVIPEENGHPFDHARFSLDTGSFATVDLYDRNPFPERVLPHVFDPETAGRNANFYTDMTFTEKLYQLMQQRGLKSPEVYRRANIERSLFSKILSDRFYMPKKDTAVALAFGLGLDLEQAQDLLKRAGYTLSHSIQRDVAIEYCFMNGLSDVIKVDYTLDSLGYAPLSRA